MRAFRQLRTVLWNVPVGLQLAAIYAILLAVVLSLLGLALYSQLDNFLVQNTAERLQRTTKATLDQPLRAGRSVLTDPRSSYGLPDDHRFVPATQQIALSLVRNLSSSDVAVAVYDADGAVITSTQSMVSTTPPYVPPLPADLADNGISAAVRYIASSSAHGRQLVVITPVDIGGDPQRSPTRLYLEQAASLEAADDVLNQLRLYLALGIIIGTLIGVLVGLALTRIVLRPLDRMAKTAEAISAGDLGRRLRLPAGQNEVARLGHSFDTMVERLASSIEAQRRFVADASHELRTPLTSLEGLSEMLLMGADRGDASVVQRTVRGMHKELGRMSRLVTDLLTLSRLDSTAPTSRTTVNVCAIAGEVAEQMAPLAESKEVRIFLQCPAPANVQAEPDKLKQVILNLVDNALRYTPQGGAVTMSAAQPTPGEVSIQVRDTGPGISPEDLPHVFDRFYRGDTSRARTTGNSGLGLSIARAIIQSHGGRISAESAPGQGATFTITLPAALSAANQPLPAQAPEALELAAPARVETH